MINYIIVLIDKLRPLGIPVLYTKLDNISELRQAVMNVIFHMKTDQFVQIVDDWVRRHKKCVELRRKKLNWIERLTSLNVKNFYRCTPGVSMMRNCSLTEV
jgi:hypothetical protein